MNAAQVETPTFLLPRAIPKEQAANLRMVSHAKAMVAAAMSGEEEQKWPPDIAEALRVLTPKQRQFAVRVSSGQPQFKAYRASYDVSEDRSDADLYSHIGQIMRDDRVSTAVELMRVWLDRKWLLDAVEVKDYTAAKFYEESITGDTSSARIKATEALARLHGLMVDKKEITHRDVNEMDEQAQLFRSILADVNLSPVLDAEYVVQPQQLTGPSLGYVCPSCNSRAKLLSAEYEDGDGI